MSAQPKIVVRTVKGVADGTTAAGCREVAVRRVFFTPAILLPRLSRYTARTHHPMSPPTTILRIGMLCLLALTTLAAVGRQEAKTVILSLVDADGRPLTDVQADDVRVREDVTDGQVLGLKRAASPLFIQVLVDTTPAVEPFVSDLRKALTAFVQRIKAGDPSAQIGLLEFGGAAAPITPITGSVDDLEKSITRIFPKPNVGSVLLEAIITASNSLVSRPSPRRAIVSFNIEPSNELSRESPNKMFLALALSGAQVWSLSLQTTNRAAPRDVVLNDVTRRTGGRREIINSSSAIQGYLEQYADVLLAQYELTYRVPGDRPAKVLLTGTTRPGARIHASTLPSQR